MRIAVPAEAPGERRVAITPQVALRLVEDRHAVVVEAGAGKGAFFWDDAYREVGAEVAADPYPNADVVLVVGPPSASQAERIPEGGGLIGMLDPFDADELVRVLVRRPNHRLRHGGDTAHHGGPDHGRPLLPGHRHRGGYPATCAWRNRCRVTPRQRARPRP